jgi:hypothetical protein
MNLLSPCRIGDETDNCENQEDEEQYLRDSRRSRGDAGKAEHGCDERDYEKDDCVMKHRKISALLGTGHSVPAERIITVVTVR